MTIDSATFAAFIAAALPWILGAITYVLIMAYARRSQIDAWCMVNPKRAGVLKIIRGILPEPWLIVQGVILLIKARLPNYILKLLPSAIVALCLLGCTMSLEGARADGIAKRAKAQPTMQASAQVRPASECTALDSTKVYFEWGFLGFDAVAAGAALTASQTDDGLRNAAVVTAAVAGGVALASELVSQRAAGQWAELCSQ